MKYNFELYFHFNTAKWSHLCNFKASWVHAGLIRKSLESRDLVSSCLSKLSRKAKHLVFLEAQHCCLSDKQRKNVSFHLSPDLNFKNCLSWTNISSIPILFFLALSKVLSPKFQLCNGAPTNSATCIRPWALTGCPAAYCAWKDWRPEIRQTPWKSPEGQQIPTEKAVTRRGWEVPLTWGRRIMQGCQAQDPEKKEQPRSIWTRSSALVQPRTHAGTLTSGDKGRERLSGWAHSLIL